MYSFPNPSSNNSKPVIIPSTPNYNFPTNYSGQNIFSQNNNNSVHFSNSSNSSNNNNNPQRSQSSNEGRYDNNQTENNNIKRGNAYNSRDNSRDSYHNKSRDNAGTLKLAAFPIRSADAANAIARDIGQNSQTRVHIAGLADNYLIGEVVIDEGEPNNVIKMRQKIKFGNDTIIIVSVESEFLQKNIEKLMNTSSEFFVGDTLDLSCFSQRTNDQSATGKVKLRTILFIFSIIASLKNFRVQKLGLQSNNIFYADISFTIRTCFPQITTVFLGGNTFDDQNRERLGSMLGQIAADFDTPSPHQDRFPSQNSQQPQSSQSSQQPQSSQSSQQPQSSQSSHQPQQPQQPQQKQPIINRDDNDSGSKSQSLRLENPPPLEISQKERLQTKRESFDFKELIYSLFDGNSKMAEFLYSPTAVFSFTVSQKVANDSQAQDVPMLTSNECNLLNLPNASHKWVGSQVIVTKQRELFDKDYGLICEQNPVVFPGVSIGANMYAVVAHSKLRKRLFIHSFTIQIGNIQQILSHQMFVCTNEIDS